MNISDSQTSNCQWAKACLVCWLVLLIHTRHRKWIEAEGRTYFCSFFRTVSTKHCPKSRYEYLFVFYVCARISRYCVFGTLSTFGTKGCFFFFPPQAPQTRLSWQGGKKRGDKRVWGAGITMETHQSHMVWTLSLETPVLQWVPGWELSALGFILTARRKTARAETSSMVRWDTRLRAV